jgi:branched-chain amino acid transport system substrate-binding protein
VRTFVRIAPSDAIQAVAQVRLQKSLGCHRTYVLDDGEVDGEDTAASFSVAAQSAGLQVAGVQAFDARATDYSSLAAAVAQTGSDCVLISAITESNAVLLTRQIAAAVPKARIFGSAGVAESTYTNPLQGGIPAALDSRVLITVATLNPASYPEAGRRLLLGYARRYGPPQPAAIYGYEAMSLLLGSIAMASDNGTRTVRRSRVVAALFATRDRRSVLGTYSIDSDGESTIRRYGVYRVIAGRLSFWKAIDA